MRLKWEDDFSDQPAYFARKVFKKCSFRTPPIPVEPVVECIGLELREFTDDDIRQYGRQIEIFNTAGAWLRRNVNGKGQIWVYKDTLIGRKRLGIFHECGHAVLPWHQELDYLCKESDINPGVQKRIEREAFECGAEFLMPGEMFVDDIPCLDTDISAIEQLSDRYIASLEAAAIRYAKVHPGMCAMVMVEAAPSQQNSSILELHNKPNRDVTLFRLNEFTCSKIEEETPLRVKYSVKSRSFPKFIKAGTGIDEENLIYDSWSSGERLMGTVPAAAFGSSAIFEYNAECLPLGSSGKTLVLLWIPDSSLKLDL